MALLVAWTSVSIGKTLQEPTDATEDGLQVTVVLLLDTASMLKQTKHSWQVEKTKDSEVFGAWFWLGMINID